MSESAWQGSMCVWGCLRSVRRKQTGKAACER